MDKSFNLKRAISMTRECFRFMWKHDRLYLFLAILKAIVQGGMVFPSLYLMSYAINCISDNAKFFQYVGIIVGLILVSLLLHLFEIFLSEQITRRNDQMKMILKKQVMEICIAVDYDKLARGEFADRKQKALMALNGSGIGFMVNNIVNLLSSIIMLIGSIIVINQVNILFLIPLGLIIVIQIFYSSQETRYEFQDQKNQPERERKDHYIRNISSNMEFAKEVRLFHLKDALLQYMKQVNLRLLELRQKSRREYLLPASILACLSTVLMEASIYLFLGYQVINGDLLMGDIALIGGVVRNLASRIENVISTVMFYVANSLYASYIFDFFKEKEFAAMEEDGISLPENMQNHTIEFRNVSFKYPGSETYALENINIKIASGTHLLIVGENGAGKTTFIKLLLRIYRPTSGMILLDGMDIQTISLKNYLTCFSTVFQDYRLFAASIDENVAALRDPEYSRAEKAYEQAGLTEKLASLKNGGGTTLYRIFDEEGVELSGGQLQKLAIARAVYKDAPIMIFDEPTSALDPLSEREIYTRFNSASKEKTTLYISHRLSSAKFCNDILVFQNGHIVEHGSHEELMKANGEYHDLFTMQMELYSEGVAT